MAHLVPPTTQPSQETAAYLAGLFDGEGCVFIATSKNGYWRMEAHIDGTGVAFLKKLREDIGSPGYLFVSRRPPKRKPLAKWIMTGKTAEWFLNLIRPWVRLKGKNIDIALEFRRFLGRKPLTINQKFWQDILSYQLRTENKLTGRARPFPGLQ